jgi:plasmid stability protein
MNEEVKLQLRLPIDVRDWLKIDAKSHERSMNGQMVAILKEMMAVSATKNEKTLNDAGKQ